MAGSSVPYIDVFGRNVEVAAQHEWPIRVNRLSEPAREAIEPNELGLIERRADDPTVRRVDTDNAHAITFSRDHPCFRKRFVVADIGCPRQTQRLAEVCDYAVDAGTACDSDAVPTAFAMVYQAIAGLAEHRGWCVCVSQLCLLHQEHVRLGSVEPPCDFLEAGLQRIDVPGCDPHVYRVSDVQSLKPRS